MVCVMLFLANQELREYEMIAQEDMSQIAQIEEGLAHNVVDLYALLTKTQSMLLSDVPNNNVKNAVSADLAKSMPPEIRAAFEHFAPKSDITKQLEKSDSKNSNIVGSEKTTTTSKKGAEKVVEAASKNADNNAGASSSSTVLSSLSSKLGPAMMIPLLQSMYDKFKVDITKATKQEQKAKDRVQREEKNYVDLKKAGKTYLLDQKVRLIKYYKKQRELQHQHYHAMLKLAHSMMERIKMVKGMCESASTGKKLTKKQQYELGAIAPKEIV